MRRGKRWTRLECLEEQQPESGPGSTARDSMPCSCMRSSGPQSRSISRISGRKPTRPRAYQNCSKRQGLPWSGITALPRANQSRLRHE